MPRHDELLRAKRIALGLLVTAALLFVLSLALPPSWYRDLLRAFSEAAMVGALADWFAVVALFRRVPIPFVGRHTAIIPSNQGRIADNLAQFVHEHFLDTESLVALIQRHDPVGQVAQWLRAPANAEWLGEQLARAGGSILDLVEERAVQDVLGRAVRSMVGSVDMAQSAGMILDSLTRERRHQQLLDAGLKQVAALLEDEGTQETIAQAIVAWLKEEHAIVEKVLPSEYLGRKGADVTVQLVATMLQQVANDAQHPMRLRFDAAVATFIERLKHDPEFARRADEIKRYVLDDAAFNGYLQALWGELRGWLKAGLDNPDSSLRRRVVAMGTWLGQTLADDAALRESLSSTLIKAARASAPGIAGYLTRHIADTVKGWDADAMATQIEANIGKDLQYIRINGTIVGGLIGVLLYLIAHLPGWLA